jgi:tRNA-dihydrouridine synthase B
MIWKKLKIGWHLRGNTSMNIGKLHLKYPIIFSPMAGVTDLPCRLINRKFGAELVFTEMIHIRSLTSKNARTMRMVKTTDIDRPLGIQLLGADEDYINRAMDILDTCDYDLLDFNAACPMPKVAKRGEGAGLLKEPVKLQKLLKLLVSRAKTPVTVKIRSGWDENSINAREVALAAQDSGIDALFIHGRHRKQGYSGKVDYNTIAEVKKALNIPVIANGDIYSGKTAMKMFDETGCDAVGVARGSLGNPWIFREIAEALKGRFNTKRPESRELVNTIIEHLDLSIDLYGEKKGILLFRKFLIWYTKGLSAAKYLRPKAFHASSRQEMHDIALELGEVASRDLEEVAA